jgi:hypothetical protein
MPITFYPSPKLNAEKINTQKNEKKDPHLIAQSTPPKDYVSKNHGFVDAVRTSYSRHHNLTIRPDDVWMAIATQFSTYIENNAEELRDKFVAHSGQKQLTVKCLGDLHTANYSQLSLAMADQIALNIKDPKVREWIMPNFSTTTNVDRVVGSMVLMASMKKYFGYKMELCCGLPSVTMLGTEADWVEVANRVKELLKYDNKDGYMKTWYDLLQPVLANFVSSIQGNPDLDWWNNCCTALTGGSGPRYLAGWLTVFSVYDNNGKWVANHRAIRSPTMFTSQWPIIESNDLAKGVVTVDVTIDDNGVEYKTVLTAGSSGYVYLDEHSIQPCLSWILRHKVEPKPMTEDERFRAMLSGADIDK